VNPGKTTEFTYRLAARLYQHSQRQPSEVFRALHTSLEGLSNEMVISRQLLYGPNEVAGKSKSSALAILVKAFRNPFNYLISTLAIVSYLTDDRGHVRNDRLKRCAHFHPRTEI
jgi:Mg2+-importing ATPase